MFAPVSPSQANTLFDHVFLKFKRASKTLDIDITRRQQMHF